MNAALQDLQYAWRSIRATPRLTLTASACAALGLGAAIFMTTIVNAVLFSTPAMPDASRLMRVWTASTTSAAQSDVSYPDVVDLRARVRAFDAVEGAARTRLALTTEVGTERLRGESVTPGYFTLVGVRPIVGRLFADAEYAPDARGAVVISFALWQRRFGGRTDIIGQPFRTRPTSRQSPGSVRTIIGVMPQGFVGTVDPDVSDFWLPVAHYEPASVLSNRSVRSTWVLARRAPGVSLSQARADVAALGAALAGEFPAAYERVSLSAEPFGETWRERFRLSLYVMLAATALLLVISCTNVATLLLVRLAQRDGELRLRLALGAQRVRLIRQLLAESLMIALFGGTAGLSLAAFALRTIARSGVFEVPPYVNLGPDPKTAIAGLMLMALTGLVFGVLPARMGSGVSIARDSGRRVSPDARQRRYGRVLVMGQVALTFVLLTGAVLLFRTHQRLVGGDLGFRTANLLRMAISPDPNVYRDAATRLALADNIKRTFDAYPGVERSAVMAGVLQPWFDETVNLNVGATEPLPDVGRHAVGPDFLPVMDIHLVEGRAFGPSDRADGAATALVSQSLARKLVELTGRSAIGQRLRATTSISGTSADEFFEVIGTVTDVVYNGPLQPRPADHDLYVPLERGAAGALSIAVHTRVDPESLIEPLSRELGRLASSSPQHWISTMEDELALQYRDARLYASLSGVFGGVATLLAVMGMYGVLANSVARRHRELGVRMAVGARASDIIRLVIGEGARTLLAGVLAGAVLSLGLSRLVSGLLYGIAPSDPLTFVIVALILLAMGLAACAVASVRASRLDPLNALRAQ